VKYYLKILTSFTLLVFLAGGCQVPTISNQPSQKRERRSLPQNKIQYMQETQPLLDKGAQTLNGISKIIHNTSNKKISQKEGAQQLRQKKQELDDVRSKLKSITPPQSMKKFHVHILNGFGYYSEGTGKVADAFDTNDQSLLDQAVNLFNKGNAEIKAARQEAENNQKLNDLDETAIIKLLQKNLISIPKIKLSIPGKNH
jgi:hypothetical protein